MADNTNRIAGTAFLALDGVATALQGAFSYRPSAPNRESLMGMDGFHGYKEKPAPGQIKATLRNNGGVSLTALGQMTNSTITCELSNGITVIGRNMFTTEAPSADAEEATIEIIWEGPDVTES